MMRTPAGDTMAGVETASACGSSASGRGRPRSLRRDFLVKKNEGGANHRAALLECVLGVTGPASRDDRMRNRACISGNAQDHRIGLGVVVDVPRRRGVGRRGLAITKVPRVRDV